MKRILTLTALIIVTAFVAMFISGPHATAQLPEGTGDTATATAPSSATTLDPRVTKFVKLSGSVSGLGCLDLIDEWGPHMAIDPANPKHLAVVYQLGDTKADATRQVGIVANSFDGGTSWTRALLPGITACSGGPNGIVGDPFIAIGGNGNVAATESWTSWDDPPTDAGDMRLYLSRSVDRGANFAAPTQPENMLKPNVDSRGPVLFDPQYPNRLFLGFERTHYTNTDGIPNPTNGQIFGIGSSLGVARYDEVNTVPLVADAAVTLPGEEALTVGLFKSGNDVVLIGYLVEDTDIAARVGSGLLGQGFNGQPGVSQAAGIPLPEHLFAVRSTDGGATFGVPKPVVRWTPAGVVGDNSPGDIGTYNNSGFTGCCIPHAAAGPGSSMYVTWTEAGTNGPSDATGGVYPAGSNGVYLARSNDGGASWTGKDSPVIVTPNGALESAVAVRDDGAIALFYYAFTPDAAFRPILTPYVAVTKDGVTWKAIPIAAPFDLLKLTGGDRDTAGMGPYQDIVALPDGFGVTLTLNDPKDPTREHVYYAKISVAR